MKNRISIVPSDTTLIKITLSEDALTIDCVFYNEQKAKIVFENPAHLEVLYGWVAEADVESVYLVEESTVLEKLKKTARENGEDVSNAASYVFLNSVNERLLEVVATNISIEKE